MSRHGPLPIRRVGSLAAVLLAALPASASAAPLWGSPHRLSPAGARNVAVAVDARGHGVVAWARPDQQSEVGIEAVIRSARAWHPVQFLGLANTLMGRSPMVAMDGRGDAFVAWVDRADNALHVAMHPPGRPWTTSVLGDAANHPVIAADAAGDAAAAWIRLGEVEVAQRPRDGDWGAPVALSAPALAADNPRVAMSATGDLTVAWQAGGWVQAAVQPASGAFGPVQPLSAPAASVASLALTSNAAGDAVAAWMETSQSPKVIQAAVRHAGVGTFDAPADVASRAALSAPDVAMGPHGRAVVTWVGRFVELAERSAMGRWGMARRVSGATNSVFSASQAVTDPRGDETIVWTGSSRAPRRLNAVQTVDRLHGRGWRRPEVVSLAREQDPSDVAVALGSARHGIMAWRSLIPKTGMVVNAALRRAPSAKR
jgi:hypothetical protein